MKSKHENKLLDAIKKEALVRFKLSKNRFDVVRHYFYIQGEAQIACAGDEKNFKKAQEIIDNIFTIKKKAWFSKNTKKVLNIYKE